MCQGLRDNLSLFSSLCTYSLLASRASSEHHYPLGRTVKRLKHLLHYMGTFYKRLRRETIFGE